jgi:hypothetical protein
MRMMGESSPTASANHSNFQVMLLHGPSLLMKPAEFCRPSSGEGA